LEGNGLNITQTHNITVGNQTFTLTGNGANFTKTNTTTTASHSAASGRLVPGLKTVFFIAFLLFTTQVYAQSPDSQLDSIESQWSSALESVLDPVIYELCDIVTSNTPTTIFEEVLEEVAVLFTCLELLMVAYISGVAGNILPGVSPNATVYGSSLPITDPTTLFSAAAGDAVICLEIALAILQDPSGGTVAEVCDPILAVPPPMPTNTGSSPTLSVDGSAPTSTADGSAPTGTPIPYLFVPKNAIATGLPAGWPPNSIWSTQNGSCIACDLSVFLNYIRTNAPNCYSSNLTPTPVPEAYQYITAFDLSLYLCVTAADSWGIAAMCDTLCTDYCTVYLVDDIVAGLGAAYNATVNGEVYCQQCEDITLYVTAQCVESEGSYDPSASSNCRCGTGADICDAPYGSCVNSGNNG